MLEREIEDYLVARVEASGGEVRKVQWIGRRGAPDRFVMLRDRCLWVELKRPGILPPAYQLREHDRLRRRGQRVEVIDTLAKVEALFP